MFVFLLLAGVLLLTGASIAGVLKATRDGMATTTQRLRRSTGEFAAVLPGATTRTSYEEPEPELEPEPEEPPEVEPVVRATHVEAPALDAASRYPDLYEEDSEREPDHDPEHDEIGEPGDDDRAPREEQEPERSTQPPDPPDPIAEPLPGEHEEAAAEALTPQGVRRSAVTEADDFDYRAPNPAHLKRSNGAQKVDTRGIERTGGQLTEALSHFNVEAKVIGTVSGPHVTRYELRLAPGIKMSKVAQLKDDLAYALAAEHVRILAPIPGKQA